MGKSKVARHARAQGRAPAKRGPSTKLIAIVAAVAVAVVGAAIILFSSSGTTPPPPAIATGSENATKGSPDAKVVITEYSDFQCPWCARYHETASRDIDTNYVSTGKVRVIYRNRAVIGPESVDAAQAALCAGDQGQFWQYADKVFASQAGENRGAFAKDKLKGFASQIGLDSGAFNSCLDSGKYASRVRSETAESQSRGVVSTPTFFINNTKLEGARPFADFKNAIEAELRRAQ